jgi:hypothetical protein
MGDAGTGRVVNPRQGLQERGLMSRAGSRKASAVMNLLVIVTLPSFDASNLSSTASFIH